MFKNVGESPSNSNCTSCHGKFPCEKRGGHGFQFANWNITEMSTPKFPGELVANFRWYHGKPPKSGYVNSKCGFLSWIISIHLFLLDQLQLDPSVADPRSRTHGLWGSDGCQTGHTAAQDEGLGGWIFASRDDDRDDDRWLKKESYFMVKLQENR